MSQIVNTLVLFLQNALETIVEKEKKRVGPSQRIIRRKSPHGRERKTVDEEEELLNYDEPPKARNSPSLRNHASVHRNDREIMSEDSASGAENSPRPTRQVRSYHNARDRNSPAASPEQRRQHNSHGSGKVVETDIDSPSGTPNSSSGTPVNSNLHTHRRQPSQSSITVDSHDRQMPGSSGRRYQPNRSQISPNNKNTPGGMRVLSGPYVPVPRRAEEEKEQFV